MQKIRIVTQHVLGTPSRQCTGPRFTARAYPVFIGPVPPAALSDSQKRHNNKRTVSREAFPIKKKKEKKGRKIAHQAKGYPEDKICKGFRELERTVA